MSTSRQPTPHGSGSPKLLTQERNTLRHASQDAVPERSHFQPVAYSERKAIMDNIIEAGQITTGIDVYGADGARVGTVTATQTDYVIVSTVDGDVLLSNTYELPATECHIPISAIGKADDRAVYLNVASDEVVALGWNTAPDYRSAATGAVGESAVDTGRATGDYQNLTAVWVNDSTASIEFDSPAMEPEEASGV